LSDGRKLGYAEYGDPKGKPAFFFHGWPSSRLAGVETNGIATKYNVRIISVERPGYGLSDYKENRKLIDWPDDIVELADHLKFNKFAIMGVSGAGPYVAACACKIPHRITNAGIVVGLGPANTKKNLERMLITGLFFKANHYHVPFINYFASFLSLVSFKYFPSIGNRFGFPAKEDQNLLKKKELAKEIDEAIIEGFRNGIKGPALDLKIYASDWGFKLKDIKAKVYLWYGAKDRNISVNMGIYYNSQIKGSKLFINPNGGHLFRTQAKEQIQIFKTLMK